MVSDRTDSGRLTELMQKLADQRYPPVHRWSPALCGEIDIRIARDGRWFYQGTPITRQRMVRLFASVLRREGDEYYLVTPVEKLRITVEDAPYTAVGLERHSEGDSQALAFYTQTGDIVIADAEHPLRVESDPETGGPRPYLHVRDGLDALISRPVFYELAEIALEDPPDSGPPGVFSRGVYFPLDTAGPGEGDG